MRRIVLFMITVNLATSPLMADVEVTLKSGASLVGKVKIDGTDAVVTIDDSELRVPLAEVDSIGSAEGGPERQAHRLLLTAIGTRSSKEREGADAIGLLAEASRLAPDDPQIAFWYASSLADAGYGQAANDILNKHRDAIAKEFPGMLDQLAARIKRRVAMESMPAALVERVDALNEELSKQPSNSDTRQMAVLFRLVDQEDVPIDRADFRVQCNGHDEAMEPYDDGFFLYMYKQHRGNNDQPCQLEVIRPGLEAKSFEFSGSSSRVQDAGKLVAKRYQDDARKPFRMVLSDPAGQPVAGATVTLTPMSARGSSSDQTTTGESDGEGNVEILAFPMRYSYHVTSEGFNPVRGNVEIRADGSEPKPVKEQIYRAVQATIRVAWEATSPQGGDTRTGESTLQVGDGSPQHGPENEMAFIRPIQQKDRLTLQFVDYPFGFGGPYSAPEPWVRVIGSKKEAEQAEAEASEAPAEAGEALKDNADEVQADAEKSGLERFNALEFDEIDKLKTKLPQPRLLGGGQQTGPRPPLVLAAEAGSIYAGRLQHRDMRTGQGMPLKFKVYIEELSSADD